MNCKYKFAVEEELDNIRQSVNVLALIDVLYEAGIAPKELCRRIREVSEKEANDLFYEHLLNYEAKFEDFVDVVLKEHVDWIYAKIRRRLDDKAANEEIFKTVLNFGDFPRKPLHFVNRKDKINQVQNVLHKLPVDGKIVLHGMAGSGKSNLVIGVMSTDLVLEVFGGKVFWIKVGDVKPDELLKLMSRFYLKITGSESTENRTSIESLKIKLQQKVREKRLYNHMLLILDNVYERSVVDAFDLGCRTVITTRNKGLLADESNTHLIEVDGTFKTEETYELFASCLGVGVEEIRKKPEAGEIHHLCKGHPLSIALFGSLMVTQKDNLLKNKSSWKGFAEMLKGRNYHEHKSAIQSCIANLTPYLREKYLDLAIFPEDVNITSKVLQVLWNLDEFEVNDLMTQLENKSLIVSYYNHHECCYNYGIHIVLLRYLKSASSSGDGHRRLIDNYAISCRGDFSKLPDDNYIYQYLGYHLKEADYINRFKVYYDLNFIDAKIKAAGVGDLLRDFEIYEEQILFKASFEERVILKELKLFVSNFGRHLHDQKDLNLVQSALMYSKGNLRKLALETASTNQNTLYFDMECFPSGCKCAKNEYKIPEHTTFVCFGLYDTHIFCGTKEGDIELMDLTDQKPILTYKGHDQKITYVEVSPYRDKFLAVSEDGVVLVWHLRDDLNKSQPSVKQKNYNNFYKEDESVRPTEILKLENNGIILSATFGGRLDSVVTSSNKNSLQIWDSSVMEKEIECGRSLRNLKVMVDDDEDRWLIVGIDSEEISVYDSRGLEVMCREVKYPISSIIIVDEDSFVTIYGNTVSYWRMVAKLMPGEALPEIREKIVCVLEEAVFLLGFVDLMRLEERILYVMSDDKKMRMFDLESGNLMGISNHYDIAIAVDVFLFSDASTTFLYRYSDNTIKKHNTKTVMETISKQTPIFDCYWSISIPRTVSIKDQNTLEILNNHKPLKDISVSVKVQSVCFSPCGDRIIYGLDNGEVFEYEIKSNSTRRIMKLCSSIAYLKHLGLKMIIAGGSRGDIMVRNHEENCSFFTLNQVSHIKLEPILETFYFPKIESILTITKDRVIKYWRRFNLSKTWTSEVLKGRKTETRPPMITTSAAMSRDNKLLAITTTNMFDVFTVTEMSDGCDGAKLELKELSGRTVGGALYCCCFSCDGKFVAFGGEDKVIMVYYVNLSKEKLQEFTKLQLHMSPVRYLLSSPFASSIFISVGEQIALWNLSKIPPENFVRRSSYRKSNCGDLLTETTASLSLTDSMSTKTGSSPSKPHLLRTIKLRGSYANYVSSSSNFSSFVTLDDEGNSYHIKVLNDNK